MTAAGLRAPEMAAKRLLARVRVPAGIAGGAKASRWEEAKSPLVRGPETPTAPVTAAAETDAATAPPVTDWKVWLVVRAPRWLAEAAAPAAAQVEAAGPKEPKAAAQPPEPKAVRALPAQQATGGRRRVRPQAAAAAGAAAMGWVPVLGKVVMGPRLGAAGTQHPMAPGNPLLVAAAGTAAAAADWMQAGRMEGWGCWWWCSGSA